MNHPRSPAQSLPDGRENWEQLLYEFEKAWQGGAPPRIEDFVPPRADAAQRVADPARRDFLEEMIKIDLERRWRQSEPSTRAAGPRLEEYLTRLPELGPADQLSLELIGEEYRTRQRWGDRPSHAQYQARFPRQAGRLGEVLRRIDVELKAERSIPSNELSAVLRLPTASSALDPFSPGPGPAVTSCAAFIDALCRCCLLPQGPLNQLMVDVVQGRLNQPRALAGELLKRSWATPYQVNQLLQGRGESLLVGPYVLLERLGQGGASQVYKARHYRMRRVVALKLIRKELLTDAEVVNRFRREIQAISQLVHPHIVRAYDAGVSGTIQYLVMEYVEGTDLNQLVKESGPLPVVRACDYLRQAALGLQHIHENGLVHRDIKPSNLLLAKQGGKDPAGSGTVKILDLGLARVCRAGDTGPHGELTMGTLTPQGAVMMGTPDYMAPEQALEFHQADIRSDIYSLGCTLCYLLTGRPPFAEGTLAQKLLKHQQAEPPEVGKLRGDVPRWLGVVMRKMLAKQPEDRYQTPAEVIAALAPVALVCEPAGRWDGLKRFARRRLWLAGLGICVLWFLIWLFYPSSPADPGNLQADHAKHVGGATCLAFSPDGMEIASGGADQTVRLWDLRSGKDRVVCEGHVGTVAAVAFAPDGQTVVSAGSDCAVKLWDRTSGRQLASYQYLVQQAHADPIVCVAYTADCRTIVVGCRQALVLLLEVAGQNQQINLKERSRFETIRAGEPGYVPITSDGKCVAAVNPTYTVRLWSVADGKERVAGPTHSFYVHQAAALSADGQLAASTDHNPTIKLWNAQTGKETAVLAGHRQVQRLTFASSGKMLASAAADGSIWVWDVAFQKSIQSWERFKPINALTFTPDGWHLATAHGNGNVCILRLLQPSR